MEIIIREAIPGDAPSIGSLSAQLGYPLSPVETSEYLSLILGRNNQNVFVAEYESSVIGWISVARPLYLVSGYSCEVRGLVIDANHHRKGAGKALIEKAKSWSKQQGCNVLRVRTNTIRKDAHKFYEQLGFSEVKEQKLYEVPLDVCP